MKFFVFQRGSYPVWGSFGAPSQAATRTDKIIYTRLKLYGRLPEWLRRTKKSSLPYLWERSAGSFREQWLVNHRRPKLTFRESKELIFYFIHLSVTAVRVGTWPFILRCVRLHENRWEFERFIRHCMGNKISLIYNAKYFELSPFFE